MSISIATMGKFTPATGGTQIVTEIVDRGSSGYGFEERQPKPRVIVRRVQTDDQEAEIKIILLNVEDYDEIDKTIIHKLPVKEVRRRGLIPIEQSISSILLGSSDSRH